MNCAPITHRAFSNAVTCGDGVFHCADHFGQSERFSFIFRASPKPIRPAA
jgi:hypothetical protein